MGETLPHIERDREGLSLPMDPMVDRADLRGFSAHGFSYEGRAVAGHRVADLPSCVREKLGPSWLRKVGAALGFDGTQGGTAARRPWVNAPGNRASVPFDSTDYVGASVLFDRSAFATPTRGEP
jgi:hypothetical protein